MKISTRQLAGILHKDHCHEIQKAGRLDKQKLKKHDNQILQKKKEKEAKSQKKKKGHKFFL